jgi:hypothetical protein
VSAIPDSIPGDAGSRAHLRSIAALTELFAPAVDPEPLPNMVPFEDLRPGQAIEHDHEFWVIVVKRSDGSMLLRREGDSHEEWLTGLHRDAPWNIGLPF